MRVRHHHKQSEYPGRDMNRGHCSDETGYSYNDEPTGHPRLKKQCCLHKDLGNGLNIRVNDGLENWRIKPRISTKRDVEIKKKKIMIKIQKLGGQTQV